jgi:hypothetical protein
MIECKGADMHKHANMKSNEAEMHLLQVPNRTTDYIVDMQNYLQSPWRVVEPCDPIENIPSSLVVMWSLMIVLTRWFRLSLLLASSFLTLNLLFVIARVMIVTWTLFSLVEILTLLFSLVAFFLLFLSDVWYSPVCGWRLLVSYPLDTLLLLCLNSDSSMLYKSTSVISSMLCLCSILSSLYSNLSFLALHTLGFFRNTFCSSTRAFARAFAEGRNERYRRLRGLAGRILVECQVWHGGPGRCRRK